MSFKKFEFHPQIMQAIDRCGFTNPTPIQEQTIPMTLAGRDVLGLAQTGTGKTAAFGLPLLQRLLAGKRGVVRALVLAPTRELAEQIHAEFTRMGQFTGLRSVVVYGGVGKQGQLRAIREGAEIIVACPGRLLDFLGEGAFALSTVETLVLDEADYMFDMGFLPTIRRIFKHLPAKRQNLLFSATMPAEIRSLAEDILHQPERVEIGHSRPALTVSHVLFEVGQAQKTTLLKTLLAEVEMGSSLIFTRTKHKAKSLAVQLEKAGFKATCLQGNLSQQKREQALNGFRTGDYKYLVATDIAARGIDVERVSHVINYDIPDTIEAYTHRIGRTGRADRFGEAFTFAGREDGPMIRQIERVIGASMSRRQVDLPEDVVHADQEIERATEKRPPRPPARNGKAGYGQAARGRGTGHGAPRPARQGNPINREDIAKAGERSKPHATAPAGDAAGRRDSRGSGRRSRHQTSQDGIFSEKKGASRPASRR
ncbi:MAG: DEAD/DEAH box helicase [Thermodesulfobacteriota bacterium]